MNVPLLSRKLTGANPKSIRTADLKIWHAPRFSQWILIWKLTALEMVCLYMLKVNNSRDFNLKCFKVNLVCYDKALLVLHTRFLSYERFFKGGKMVVYPISPSPPTYMLTKNWKIKFCECSNHFFRQKPLQRKYLFQITNVFFLNH